MNNIYYDYIGAKGSYEINDYVDNVYTDNNITILDNKYNKLIKTIDENITTPTQITLKHTNITNSNIQGRIDFTTRYNTNDYRNVTRIKENGEIECYYEYSVVYPTVLGGWYGVMDSIRDAYNYQAINGGINAEVQLAINDIYKKYYALVAATATTFSAITGNQMTQARFAEIVVASSRSVAYNRFNVVAAVTGVTALGIYTGVYAYFNSINYNATSTNILYSLSNLDLNIYSNITQTEKDNAINTLVIDNLSNLEIGKNELSNLSINLGFINSNITTPQLIPKITTNEIIYNGTEISTTLNNYLQKAGGTMSGRLNFNYGAGIFGTPVGGGGGSGERINLNTNGITIADYPPSVGVGTNSLWLSAPLNHSYQWWIGGNNAMSLTSSILTFTNGTINTQAINLNGQSIQTVAQNTILTSTPNVSKKYMLQFTCTTPFLMPNGITYYKYDIDLRNYTQTKIINNPNTPYRIFKIKLWIASGYYEYLYNGNYNVLSYEVFMSNQSQGGGGGIGSAGINLRAIGTPENPILNGITPTQISLVRSADFNFICCLAIVNNTQVYSIIEDCLF
jgi:hypothetical protein